MASNLEFVQYVAQQLCEAGIITYRKMFGEYGVYCDGKFFAVVCDNQFFVKITQKGRGILKQCPEVAPYEGAKPYFLIEDVDDTENLVRLTIATCEALPTPKEQRRKQSGKARL